MSEESKRNSLNCFNIRSWFIFIFMLMLCILPFISILMIRFGGGYNVVKWNEYYQSGDNYEYNTTGTFMSYSNITTDQQFRLKDAYYTLAVPTGNGNASKNITYGSKQYQFVINGTSDISFTSQYTFPKKTIYHYYPVLYGLPLSVTSGKQIMIYDKYTQTSYPNETIEKHDYIIPWNWTDIWDNIDIIFYYVDKDNNGIGISYGNNQSDTFTTYERKITTDFGELNLNILPLNVSGELYNKSMYFAPINVTDNIMVSKYHSSPFSNDTFLSNYISEGFGFTSDDIFNGITKLTGIDLGGVGANSYQYTEYDNTVFEIRQLQGFPSWYEYPTLNNAEKCGFYINIKKELNVTKYFEIYDNNDMDRLFKNNEYLMNGIAFWDGGLYLGKMETMIQAIERVIIYDAVIILGTISGLVIVSLAINYPKKADEYKKLRRTSCILD